MASGAWVYGRLMRREAAVALDLRGLAERFADALEAAGFDFEHPSLATALRGYEEWLRKPVRGLERGESDCAIVAMEPLIAAGGAFAIELRRHVGEPDGGEPSIDLQLAFRPDWTPGIRGLWGTVVEAFDASPALWIAGQLRQEPAIAAALADERPLAALLRVNGELVRNVAPDSQGASGVAPLLMPRRSSSPGRGCRARRRCRWSPESRRHFALAAIRKLSRRRSSRTR
jgi:hypothetical protein